MALTIEQWEALQARDDNQSHLMTGRERAQFFEDREARAAEAARLEQMHPFPSQKHRHLMETDSEYAGRFHMRALERTNRMNHKTQPIFDEEWSIVVGHTRDLEDLVLECVEAGINIEDYL